MRDDYKVLEQDLFKCYVSCLRGALHELSYKNLLKKIINYLIRCTKNLNFYECKYIYIYYVIEKLHFTKILNI